MPKVHSFVIEEDIQFRGKIVIFWLLFLYSSNSGISAAVNDGNSKAVYFPLISKSTYCATSISCANSSSLLSQAIKTENKKIASINLKFFMGAKLKTVFI